MTIKKAISVSLLLFVNMLMLAHIVIPHHHHEEAETVCLFDTHCKDSKEAHNHECHDTHNHDHEGNPTENKCCIDKVYTRADNNARTCSVHKNCNCWQTLYTLIPNNFNAQDFVDDTVIHFRQKPHLPLFYTDFVAQSIGLRAPPAC